MNNIDLAKAGTMPNLKKTIDKELNKEAEVVSISLFMPSSHLSTVVNLISVNYSKGGGERVLSIYPGQAIDSKDEKSNLRVPEFRVAGQSDGTKYGRIVHDYDYSIVASNVAVAGKKVVDAGYVYSGVGTYSIHFYEDPDMDVHSFTILSKIENSAKIQGRNIVTEYYEIPCSADSKGLVVVELDEEENEKGE